MKKHCMLLRKTSGSVFLKDVAQARTISLLFPDYDLCWEQPKRAQTVLLLDTSVNPMQFRENYSWLSKVKKVEVLPGMKKPFERILPCSVYEVSL